MGRRFQVKNQVFKMGSGWLEKGGDESELSFWV